MPDRYVEAHVSTALTTEAMEQGLEVRVRREELFLFGTVAFGTVAFGTVATETRRL